MKKQGYPVNEKIEQNKDSISADDEPEKGKKDFYEYSRIDQAKHIKEQLQCTLISILALLLLVSLIIYVTVFSLKFVIVSTKYYGDVEHCMLSNMEFNGWNFVYKCLKCSEGFSFEAQKLVCAQETQI